MMTAPKPIQDIDHMISIDDAYEQLNSLIYERLSKYHTDLINQSFRELIKKKEIGILDQKERDQLEEIYQLDTLPLNFIELIVKLQQLPENGETTPSQIDLPLAKMKKLYDLEGYLNSNQLGSLSQILFGIDVEHQPKKNRFSWIGRQFRGKKRREVSRVVGTLINDTNIGDPVISEIMNREFYKLNDKEMEHVARTRLVHDCN